MNWRQCTRQPYSNRSCNTKFKIFWLCAVDMHMRAEGARMVLRLLYVTCTDSFRLGTDNNLFDRIGGNLLMLNTSGLELIKFTW